MRDDNGGKRWEQRGGVSLAAASASSCSFKCAVFRHRGELRRALLALRPPKHRMHFPMQRRLRLRPLSLLASNPICSLAGRTHPEVRPSECAYVVMAMKSGKRSLLTTGRPLASWNLLGVGTGGGSRPRYTRRGTAGFGLVSVPVPTCRNGGTSSRASIKEARSAAARKRVRTRIIK